MKTWNVPVEITHATGIRTYRVEAETAEAALDIVRGGGGNCIEEEMLADEIEYPDNAEDVREAQS
jgi:hypothetical protein